MTEEEKEKDQKLMSLYNVSEAQFLGEKLYHEVLSAESRIHTSLSI